MSPNSKNYPLTLTITREGYLPATVTLQPVPTVRDRISEHWTHRGMREEILALDATSHCGNRIICLLSTADELLDLIEDEGRPTTSVVAAVIAQANVILFG